MSAPAINPAPSPAADTGNRGAASSAGGAQGAHGAQAQSPLGVFEAILANLGAGDATPVATPATGAATVKTAAGGKTATDDGKTKDKIESGGQTAGADAGPAGAKPDPSLALMGYVVSSLPAAVTQTQPTSELAGGQTAGSKGTGGAVAGATNAADKGAKAAEANSLAQLAAGAADPDAAKAAAAQPGALAADNAQVSANASATAKAVTALAKPNLPQTPQAATPATPPPAAAGLPPEASPAAAAATAAVTPPTAPPADPTVQQAASAAPKDRVEASKTSTRVDVTKAQTGAGGTAELTARAADALQPVSGGDSAKGGGPDQGPVHEEAEVVAKADTADPAPAQTPADPATAATTTPATLVHAQAIAVRGAPQTVANLAAQIVKKLDGRSSQFDVQLDPAGLGKVNVHIDIASDGRMTAAMSFDTPQAAAELKARAGELHQAMQQAGFDLSGGMSFDVASDRGQGGQAQNQQPDTGAAFRGRAFQAALDTTADVAPPPQLSLRRAALAGVDIRI